MTVEAGKRYKLFVRIHHIYTTGVDFVDRENRFYMAGDEVFPKFGEHDRLGDCLLISAIIEGGSDPGRILLGDIEVLKNYGPKIGNGR
jgi:hypothetical protein